MVIVVAMCTLLIFVMPAAAQPSTPFVIDGSVFSEDGTACNNPTVNVANLDTSKEWQANTHESSNHYLLVLSTGTDLNASETLQFDVTSPDECQSITEHLITQAEINSGGLFDFDLGEAPTPTPTPGPVGVPEFRPFGLLALIGILSVVLAAAVMMRRKK